MIKTIRSIFILFLFNSFILAETTPSPAASIVLFGATGDLTAKKLIPALYQLDAKGALSDQLTIVGFARSKHSHASFRQLMQQAIEADGKKIDPLVWERFQKKITYHSSDLNDPAGYLSLKEHLSALDTVNGSPGNRLYYLSIQPSFFPAVLSHLQHSGLITHSGEIAPWTRVIVEKPFGTDLNTALQLQTQIAKNLDDSQVYRMDHYLGKIGLQNILSLRFENIFLESLWSNRYIDYVQITLSEQIGIGTRAAFWEETGALRDLMQNHIMQLLAFVAMEPPLELTAAEIHKEKITLLKSIRPNVEMVRGQYSEGEILGKLVPGYFQEVGVLQHSQAETFVAAKLWIDTPRWSGVPFYLRAGKRLAKQATEIVLKFKGKNSEALLIRIQPEPGVFIKTLSQSPDLEDGKELQVMGYRLDANKQPPEAYEKLFYEALKGNQSLFVPFEEQKTAWELFTPVLENWKASQELIPAYPAGSWGPMEADTLLEERHTWIEF